MRERKAEGGEVFISYSWDDPQHVENVLKLSNRLRFEGVDCELDQYHESPPEGWPRWTERKIRDSRFVLVVCTETYLKRIMGDVPDDEGLGVKWEGSAIYQHIYNAGSVNYRFVPVLLRRSDAKFIPTPLQGATRYFLEESREYERLVDRLLGRSQNKKPKLGRPRPRPKREVKTGVSLFFSTPIDIEQWNQAVWRGTFFMVYEELPPVLGLGFTNEGPAKKIFEQWLERFGDGDKFEEIRISLIEGDIPGEQPGYTVHVGPDLDNMREHYRQAGVKVTNEDMFLTVSRFHRMNPEPGSKNLERFKEAYRTFKTYYLAPGLLRPGDDPPFKALLDLRIFKRNLFFRRAEEIKRGDVDSVVFGKPKR